MKKQYFITIFLFSLTLSSIYFVYRDKIWTAYILLIVSSILFVVVFLRLFLHLEILSKYIQIQDKVSNIQSEQESLKKLTTALITSILTILVIIKDSIQITDKHKELINKQLKSLKNYLGEDKTKKYQNILEKL